MVPLHAPMVPTKGDPVVCTRMPVVLSTTSVVRRTWEMALDAPFSDEKDCHIVSERNCSRCGSGLGFVSCPQCGGDFQDGQSCTVWGTPLSLKMVKFLLGLGYKFIIDPAEGQEEEQRQFEESMRLLEAKKD